MKCELTRNNPETRFPCLMQGVNTKTVYLVAQINSYSFSATAVFSPQNDGLGRSITMSYADIEKLLTNFNDSLTLSND